MLTVRGEHSATVKVSIRTRPEGRVMLDVGAQTIIVYAFQSAPGPRAG